MPRLARPRNDPLQYDDLAAEWWRPRGAFAALHWLAAARAALVPDAPGDGGLLVDVACGGGLLAPHLDTPRLKAWRHVGVDIGEHAVRIARTHGVETVRGDVTRLPLADASADVVVAGEIFEHVRDLPAVVAEVSRVLRPGGTLVCDTLADTWVAKLLLVTIGERLPGVAPPGIHDPALFVDPRKLQTLFAAHGVRLKVRGLRPAVLDALRWRVGLRDDVRMLPMRWPGVVYQGLGVKEV